jgi:hypothetical protein
LADGRTRSWSGCCWLLVRLLLVLLVWLLVLLVLLASWAGWSGSSGWVWLVGQVWQALPHHPSSTQGATTKHAHGPSPLGRTAAST